MRNTIISRLTGFIALSLAFDGSTLAQPKTISKLLSGTNCKQCLSDKYQLAVLPIATCIPCEAYNISELRKINRKEQLVLVFPAARKLVQDKLRQYHQFEPQRSCYIFNDSLYEILYLKKEPKGYYRPIRKGIMTE